MSARIGLLIFLLLFLLPSCDKINEVRFKETAKKEISQENYERQIEELKKAVKQDIKIRLKRDSKGSYSWEIQGKDVNEVLKVNDILKRRLSE